MTRRSEARDPLPAVGADDSDAVDQHAESAENGTATTVLLPNVAEVHAHQVRAPPDWSRIWLA